MKILYFKIKKKKKKITSFLSNVVIAVVLLTVMGFSFAGGTLNVFNSYSDSSAIYHGNLDSKNVALMINVYWGDEYIDDMLEIFKDKNVKATFFVGGVWASKNLETMQKILQYNCELANHGYKHKDQDKISEQDNYNEIFQTHQIVKSLTGVEMNLFAPPSGAYNSTTLSVAESLGYKTIMWTKDTIDWRDQDKNLIYNRAIKDAKGGDLILMHPTAKTLEALPEIIDYFIKNNFNVTTVSETIA